MLNLQAKLNSTFSCTIQSLQNKAKQEKESEKKREKMNEKEKKIKIIDKAPNRIKFVKM